MYKAHFGLQQDPFSIAPDPSFLFLSDAHNEALAHLLYGFSHGGFVLITGEVGTGKTTLLRNLLNKTPPELDVAFILNPRLTVRELLESLCDELGIPYQKSNMQSVKQYIDLLNKHLLLTHQSGRSTVVIIDEAQNLTPAVLEQIRLLTNLETNEKKLLRIILLGQPELADQLARTELRQLAQRITARYHLTPLNAQETRDYVNHRLARVGGNPSIFKPSAIKALYRHSKGTPRLINVIADRALLGAYVQGAHQVDAGLISGAAREVFGNQPRTRRTYWVAAAALLFVIGGAMLWAFLSLEPTTPEAADTANVAPIQSGRTQGPSERPVTVAPAQPNEAATPTSVNEPAPAPVVIERPALSTAEMRRQAYRSVFARWGADFPLVGDEIPCDFAPQVGLQCLRRNGGWSELEQLDTPAVLELLDENPTPYYAALLRADTNRYEIELGDESLLISRQDLRDNWFGSYVMLWQTPPDYTGSLRLGDRHSSVGWLRDKLIELAPALAPDATAGAADPNYFDASLRQAVLAFQRREGLLADGIVGPMTWIRVGNLLDLPAPKLRS